MPGRLIWERRFENTAFPPERQFSSFVCVKGPNEIKIYKNPNSVGFRVLSPKGKPALVIDTEFGVAARPKPAKTSKFKYILPTDKQAAKLTEIFEKTHAATIKRYQELLDGPGELSAKRHTSELDKHRQILDLFNVLEAYRKPKPATRIKLRK
jgi:hypothetical protein